MKVTFINGSAPPMKCGVGNYGAVLLEKLNDQETTLVTSSGLGKNLGATKLITLDGWSMPNLPKLIYEVKATKPDVVHLQYPAVGFGRQLGINIFPLLWRLIRPFTPVIVTLHEYHSSALLGKIRNIITIMFANKIIVSNEVDKRALPLFVRYKTTIIPIGSNLDRQPRDTVRYKKFMKEAGLDPSLPTVVFFGFTNASKGVDVLVDSADKLNAQVLLLTELGDDKYSASIEESVQKHQQNGIPIYIAGFLPDDLVSVILQECLIFALPQPLPITAKSGTTIAAAQHDMIIVSTANPKPGLNLPYENNLNSVLLDDISPKLLAQSINTLLSDKTHVKDIREHVGELGQYFSWEKIAKLHTELYSNLVRK